MDNNCDNLTEELRNYSTIINKNIEIFEQFADSISNEIKIKGDPKTFPENLDSGNILLKEQTCNLFTKVKRCEAEFQLYKDKLLHKKDDNTDIKEQITECIEMLKELVLRKDDSHKKVKGKHNAYKQSCYYYKVSLDLYVHVEQEDESTFLIKFCFFTDELNDTYSTTLQTNDQKEWKLRSINPKIMDCQFIALKQRLEKTNNIIAFICTLRKIFLLLRSK